jgi:hypothetical protein
VAAQLAASKEGLGSKELVSLILYSLKRVTLNQNSKNNIVRKLLFMPRDFVTIMYCKGMGTVSTVTHILSKLSIEGLVNFKVNEIYNVFIAILTVFVPYKKNTMNFSLLDLTGNQCRQWT